MCLQLGFSGPICNGRSVEEKPVPTRAQQLKRLASGEEFDVLVVGGGATGGAQGGSGSLTSAG